MKTKLVATLLLAGSSLFAGPRIRFGIGVGVPVAPVIVAPPVAAYVPPCPGPGYEWIGGSWVFRGAPVYRPGYFHAPVYAGPRYFRHR
jgi:hypothetical protein